LIEIRGSIHYFVMLPEYFTRERYPVILSIQPQYQANAGTNSELEVKKGMTSFITSQEGVGPIFVRPNGR